MEAEGHGIVGRSVSKGAPPTKRLLSQVAPASPRREPALALASPPQGPIGERAQLDRERLGGLPGLRIAGDLGVQSDEAPALVGFLGCRYQQGFAYARPLRRFVRSPADLGTPEKASA